MKISALAALALAAGLIAAPATVAASQPSSGCLTHTLFGVPLAEPHCGPTWKNTNAPRPSYFKRNQPASVSPNPSTPVTPTDPVETCTTIPGSPIYENQIVGYTDGAPIRERQMQYKTVTIPGVGSISVPTGYAWVTVGYEQVPVYGDVQVGTGPDSEVCEPTD
jgi:hypothetical protein